MNLDWKTIDRYLMGEAWIGSHIAKHAHALCEEIGPHWSSSEAESQAIRYIQAQMVADGLDRAEAEPFELHTWSYSKAEALKPNGQPIDLVPFNRCPPCHLKAPLVDVGFGTPHKLEAADTIDKLNVRELKEYAGQMARLLLRLSHQPPEAWPDNPLTEEMVQQRLENERGTVVRVS